MKQPGSFDIPLATELRCRYAREFVKKPTPIEFLEHAQADAKTSAKIQAALEKGAAVTTAEVLKIAKASGFTFTSKQFEQAVKKSYAERFAAGDTSLADVVKKVAPRPPQSSCARGCLSYTKSWHPTRFTEIP
jgi:Skp family chaperone for outer membrane proteins